METQEMGGGRELDALIAEKVMGWSDVRMMDHIQGRDLAGIVPPSRETYEFVPNYSTNIAAAWQVVRHLRGLGWIVRVQEMPEGLPFLAGTGWEGGPDVELPGRASCSLHGNPIIDKRLGRSFVHPIIELAETPEVAICRAALTASAGPAGRGRGR